MYLHNCTKPFHHFANACDESLIFLLRICVVIAKVRDTIMCFCITETKVDSHGMTNVQDAVGLRRKPSDNLGVQIREHS